MLDLLHWKVVSVIPSRNTFSKVRRTDAEPHCCDPDWLETFIVVWGSGRVHSSFRMCLWAYMDSRWPGVTGGFPLVLTWDKLLTVCEKWSPGSEQLYFLLRIGDTTFKVIYLVHLDCGDICKSFNEVLLINCPSTFLGNYKNRRECL